ARRRAATWRWCTSVSIPCQSSPRRCSSTRSLAWSGWVSWRARSSASRTHPVERADGGYTLSIPLPFVEKGDVDLLQVGDELVVTVGAHKRNIQLPRILLGLESAGARFEGDTLKIRFTQPGAGQNRPGSGRPEQAGGQRG